MKKLDECLSKTRRIKELEEQIEELRVSAMSPRNQIITGMPRGGAVGNQSDSYIIKLEWLEKKHDKLKKENDALWDSIVSRLEYKHIRGEHIELLRHRFYRGLQWRKCCSLMSENYPASNWNMNKVFRVYRQILRKLELD